MNQIDEALTKTEEQNNNADEEINGKPDKPGKSKGLTFVYIIQVICLVIIGTLLMGGGALSREKIYLLWSVILVAVAGAFRIFTHYFPRHKEVIDENIEAPDISSEMPSWMTSQESVESETSDEVGTEYEESENSAAGKKTDPSSEWVTVDSKGTRSFKAASSNKNEQADEGETDASDTWVRNK